MSLVTSAMIRMHKRKFVPSWSLPTELFVMLLAPAYCSRGWTRSFGIGHQLPRAYDLRWLSNRTGMKGGGDRLLHGLCPFWRSFARCIRIHRGQPLLRPLWSHGCLPARRRESAMLIQRDVSWRLQRSMVSYLDMLFDTSAAFQCPAYVDLDANISVETASDLVSLSGTKKNRQIWIFVCTSRK